MSAAEAADARGALLFEHRPPRAHPILPAGVLVFGVVFAMGAVEAIVRGRGATILAWYALPWLSTLLLLVALLPSPTRIFERGIVPSRPLVAAWRPAFIAWGDLAAVYPCSYDVTGAFVSPFASSDGKVTQTGLALEAHGGRVRTVKFTPTHFTPWEGRTPDFEQAWSAVQDALARQGRVAIPQAERLEPSERDRLARQAAQPFLPFFAIVFLVAGAAPILWAFVRLGVPVPLALPLSLLAPVGVSVRSYVQSRRRNAILSRLHKAAAFERQAQGPA